MIAVAVLIIIGCVIFKAHPVTAPATGNPTLEQTVSDGTITVGYPSDFGLAKNATQVLVHAYIPPCDENFDYCLYYNGAAYTGTNFESAGVRIAKRADLATASLCLQTLPNGYTSGLTPKITTGSDYQTSVFSPLGDGATGHYASGALYRLAYGSACYEFETRIGETQFANYPAGTIQEFTTADRAAVQAKLDAIATGVTLPGGGHITFAK